MVSLERGHHRSSSWCTCRYPNAAKMGHCHSGWSQFENLCIAWSRVALCPIACCQEDEEYGGRKIQMLKCARAKLMLFLESVSSWPTMYPRLKCLLKEDTALLVRAKPKSISETFNSFCFFAQPCGNPIRSLLKSSV